MSNIALKRDEVHPLNEYRPPAAPNGYRLVRWKPIYDQIVAGHIFGKSNKELSAEYDFSEVHIGNILRSDNAQILIAEASRNIRAAAIDKSVENVDMTGEIQKKAQERIRDFVMNDELAYKQPFSFFDRVKSLSGLEAPKAAPNVNVNIQNNQTQANVSLKEEHLGRIAQALEISNG